MTPDKIAAIRAAAERIISTDADPTTSPKVKRGLSVVRAKKILRLLDETEAWDFPPITVNRDGTERPTAIAVDFDGCLATNAWPEIGEANKPLIDALIKFKASGGELILWTCREGAVLDQAVNWCWGNFGLRFDALNANLPAWKAMYGNDTRKIGADIYLDDKAICVRADDRLRAQD